MAPTQAPEGALAPAQLKELGEQVRALAAERGAVILAHNYQLPEIQDVADYVGDSLGLSRSAARSEAETIVFCGVHFMAETASVLCPDKTVLIPDLDAGCSLADSIDAEQLAQWRERYPRGIVVMYVNTTAEVKALSDYCCTSANACATSTSSTVPTRRSSSARTCGSAPTSRSSSAGACTCGTGSATCTRASVPPTSKPRARATPARSS
jgi:quinolinate synthase